MGVNSPLPRSTNEMPGVLVIGVSHLRTCVESLAALSEACTLLDWAELVGDLSRN